MKYVISAGGTAGHINPALATAEELTRRNHQVIFAGTPNRLESKLVPQSGYKFKAFNARGFNRNKPISIFTAVSSILSSTKKAEKWLNDLNPDAVIGFGCYVSLAICRAAKKLNIPVIIHEQNSVMGMANKYISTFAKATCLTYERANTNKIKHVEITGNPVRSSVLNASKAEGRKMLDVPIEADMLLVFGGSLGAKKLNKSLIEIADELLKRNNLYIVHITGKEQYKNVIENLNLSKDMKNRYKVLDYQNKMGETLAAADLCICRAGASTLSELTARAIPALLVPFPYATENHQFHNAKTLLDCGCAWYVKDENVDKPEFKDKLIKLVDNKELRNKMRDSYKLFNSSNAAKKIVDIIENSSKHWEN